MNYSFRGVYDSLKNYQPKDVVSFTSSNGITRYYFCLLPNSENNQQPPSSTSDTDFWAIINRQSDFPNGVDTFLRRTNLRATDRQSLNRYQELLLMTNLSSSEQDELENLTEELRDKLILPQDFNQLQQSIENLQMFFKDNVEAYIENKQNEFEDFIISLEEQLLDSYDQTILSLEDTRDEFVVFVDGKESDLSSAYSQTLSSMDGKKNEFTVFVEGKEVDITQEFNDAVEAMRSRRNTFSTFVSTKEDEIRALVQEFDSNTARYYQYWDADQGQVIFNIYEGNKSDIPPEANLNIAPENIDLVVNGTMMRPYADYVIVHDGNFDKISLTGSASSLIDSGTEVVARWYKNVGKLYFSHSSSHQRGASDELTNLDYRQFNEDTREMLVKVGTSQPSHGIWFKEL